MFIGVPSSRQKKKRDERERISPLIRCFGRTRTIMMKTRTLAMLTVRANLSVVLALGWIAALELPASAQRYSQLVVFGDSLSDTGNLFALSGGLFPPPSDYYRGRYSNGILWVEHLAPKLGLS